MNCLFTAKSSSLRPLWLPSSLHSNMLSQLLHWCERGNSSSSFHWTFISIWPQAHSKQRQKMKPRRSRRQWRSRQLLHLALNNLAVTLTTCHCTERCILFGDGDNALMETGTFYHLRVYRHISSSVRLYRYELNANTSMQTDNANMVMLSRSPSWFSVSKC